MLDVVVPEVHQNNRSYVHELSVPSWWVVKQKTTEVSKLGGGRLPGQYGITFHTSHQDQECSLGRNFVK